jgi:hypothetical protein
MIHNTLCPAAAFSVSAVEFFQLLKVNSRNVVLISVKTAYFHTILSVYFNSVLQKINAKKTSGALVLQRTIPTERPPLVGEVSANFSG